MSTLAWQQSHATAARSIVAWREEERAMRTVVVVVALTALLMGGLFVLPVRLLPLLAVTLLNNDGRSPV